MTEEAELRALARVARQTFYAEKSRVLGRPYKPKDRHDNLDRYIKIAQLCLTLRADPRDFVQAAFQQCNMAGGPFANMLASETAVRWWKATVKAITPESGAAEGQDVDLSVMPCEMDLKTDIELTQSMFLHNTGSTDFRDPANLALMRSEFSELPCTGRALLGSYDPEVLTKFGKVIYEFFTTRPNYTDAARKMGYPIDATLQWIHDQVLLKQ